MRSPCPDNCPCHTAGPSTLPTTTTWNRTAPALLLAALITPAFAAPPPTAASPDLAFLYPALARRVTDAGQAPDEPADGFFSPEDIAVDDLVRAGLPLKFVFDPTASPDQSSGASNIELDVQLGERSGAWVVDDYWELHGKRFGPVRVCWPTWISSSHCSPALGHGHRRYHRRPPPYIHDIHSI
jgi:hypothetical protein